MRNRMRIENKSVMRYLTKHQGLRRNIQGLRRNIQGLRQNTQGLRQNPGEFEEENSGICET